MGPVFWTRGYRYEGQTARMGLVVFRPGWVAFLPLGAVMGAAELFAHGASGMGREHAHMLRMDVPWQGRYPILAWWQHGPRALDEEVHRALAQEGALMITTVEGALVRRKLTTTFFSRGAPNVSIAVHQAPPPELLAGWRPGALPLDEEQLKKTLFIITAVLAVMGAGCEAIIDSQEGYVTIMPFGMFAALIVFSWVLYFRRLREHRREEARAAAAGDLRGPYR